MILRHYVTLQHMYTTGELSIFFLHALYAKSCDKMYIVYFFISDFNLNETNGSFKKRSTFLES